MSTFEALNRIAVAGELGRADIGEIERIEDDD